MSRLSAVDASYLKWVDRMRIPPTLHRHPLDFDWPTLEEKILKKKNISSSAAVPPCTRVEIKVPREHPRGPHIDFTLMEQISRDAFESLALQHFEVVDMSALS